MPKPRTADIQFLERDTRSIKKVIENLRGLDLPLEFHLQYSRLFRLGTLEFALLFNREVFQNVSDLLRLTREKTILGVVAFYSPSVGAYQANRVVVIEPRGANKVSIQVFSVDGELHYKGEGAIDKNKLVANIPVSLPGIPVAVKVKGELTAAGDIRIAPGGFSIRTKSRAPSVAPAAIE